MRAPSVAKQKEWIRRHFAIATLTLQICTNGLQLTTYYTNIFIDELKMERIKYTKLLHAILFILLSGLLWSCTDERVDVIPTIIDKGKIVTVSVKIPGTSVPKAKGPTTYALSEDSENEVSEVVVLLFDIHGNFTYQPIYIGSSYITTHPTDSQIKTFTVKVPEGIYDMVVLANANQTLGNALSTISEERPKAEVLGGLLLANDGKWNATLESPGYIPIPMWGEITGVDFSGSASINISVKLVRMLAKIDVSLASTTAKENFNLESVRLYNYYNKGQVIPNESNWDKDLIVVSGPSIPATAEMIATPLIYDGSVIKKENSRGFSCNNEIYTFETDAGNASTLSENSCLVVGGKYGSDSQTTFYRIDFGNNSGNNNTYLPLLRNHTYQVNILDVKGRGLPTAAEAFNSRPVNIDANVINWDDAQITNIVFDGDFMLGVSQDLFTFTREARTSASDDNILFITTDNTSGWKVEKIIDADGNNINSTTNPTTGWLKLSPNTGISGATTTTEIAVKLNSKVITRKGFIHLIAGRLRYIVKVEQLSIENEDLSISIADVNGLSINVLEFGAYQNVQPASKMFNLRWTPISSSLTYILTPLKNNFIFDTAAGSDSFTSSGIVSDVSGTKTFTVRPSPITSAEMGSNPFYERSSTLLYTNSDGSKAVFKTLTLKQFVYNMIPTVQPVYKMDGTRKSFSVRANTPFTVSVKSDPNNVITLRTITGTANTLEAGTPVYFDIANDMINPTLFQKNIVVTIKSPSGYFPDKDVTLNCASAIIQPKANSYIVAPNDFGILIPVSRANESMLGNNRLTENAAFTAELVWTDNANRLAATSNIRVIKSTDKGPSAYLAVYPGSAQGNGVVAIKLGNTILWSWHIWVTDFTPTGSAGTLMDRNLGAIGKIPGVANTKGLLYQWGRKDPFPGSTSINGNTESVLYNTTGSISINKPTTTATSNFVNTVINPASYYQGSSNNGNDWYSSSSNTRNDDLWGKGSTKTVYDPCPEGWRVPAYTIWEGLTTSNFVWNSGVYGRTMGNGNFYPAAGSRNSGGSISGAGEFGYYWSALIKSNNQPGDLYFGSSSVSSSSNVRANGYSVRCVKE